MEGSTPHSGALKNPTADASSILRTGPDAELLRHRMERPARFGRVILPMFGAVTAAAGLAMLVVAGSALDLALGAFGLVLIVLGLVQHLLFRRDRSHWPDEACLWDDGLELVLHNGEVRGASWSDPDFALHLIARRAPAPTKREYLLIWLMESRIPPVEITAEGFDQVRRMAVDRGLQMQQTQRGTRRDATQHIDIRQSQAVTAAALAKGTESGDPG